MYLLLRQQEQFGLCLLYGIWNAVGKIASRQAIRLATDLAFVLSNKPIPAGSEDPRNGL